MAFTATGEDIRCVTGSELCDADLFCFIVAANAKVGRVANCDPTLTDSELTSIANWYAAYLMATGRKDINASKSEEQFEQYKVKFGTSSTSQAKMYWNTANDLSGGCLTTLDKQSAQIAVL